MNDVSFTINRGERVAFVGPNGAGKSTSIKMLTGILYPSAGTATVLGLTPWENRRGLTERIGTLFGQRSLLWDDLPARRTYWLLAAIYGLDDETLADRLDQLGRSLDATDLYDQPMRSLSLGQRMRCELTATLLHRPEIVFLDEPTIGLDLVAKQRFRELLVRINEEHHTTIFLTSHDAADIEQVAERCIIINHGRIVADLTIGELVDLGDEPLEKILGDLYEQPA